jgi:phosphate transport system protein
MARDMRFVVVAIKINTDLERMGDLAVNIVERSLALMDKPVPHTVDFAPLSTLVESMVLSSLDSFVKRDVQIARGILTSDDAVDLARKQVEQQVIKIMREDATTIPDALDYIIVARSLERIADHATNIAADVIFLVQGVDVRHQTSNEAA